MRNRKELTMFVVSLAICLLLVRTSTAQSSGTITGTVADENGEPMSQAKVNADPMDSRPRGSAVRYVETDSNGHFTLDRLAWGKYRVFAKKEDAGYPDLAWSFYSNDIFSTATITAPKPHAELQIRLGPKCAVLTGIITNAANGAPVSAGFKLTRVTDPQKWISTSLAPDYRVLLPPSTDVSLEVSAPGFITWKAPAPLHASTGSEMHLDIPLEPAPERGQASHFLVPEGYVGWVELEYGVNGGEETPVEDGAKIFRFSQSGHLVTSSPGPERGTRREFFYYAKDGSVREIPSNYRSGRGMIWGEHDGTRAGILSQFSFFIGPEEEYKRRPHP